MMRDQTAFGISTQAWNPQHFSMNAHDRRILRRLAGQVREWAERPLEAEKRKLWYRHNALGETRPLIFCDPENGWNEIVREEQLESEGELARHWENRLRKEIFWGGRMGDDRVTEAHFNVFYLYHESDWGMHERRIGGEGGGSYRWEAPLQDYGDRSKLHFPRIEVDYQNTETILNLAQETFQDLLSVRLKGAWYWSIGLTYTLVNLRGLEQSMLDIYDHPEELHELMAFIRDGYLAKLDFLESEGLLSLNNDGTYVGSGGFGYTHELPQGDFNDHVRTRDMWGFSESQETIQISPRMFAEFVFPYQLPILERFGLNCYGCCEPLDKRWEVVARSPRLRRVSVSPWANWADMADQLGARYIYSLKPNPADLAGLTIDAAKIRADLRKALQLTRNCRVEVIMKDNHTIGNNPANVIDWCRIAKEEADSL